MTIDWEPTKRDDTPESVLKSCKHDTTAVWHDDEDMSDVTIQTDGDSVDVKWGRDFNGNAFNIPMPLLRAINEAVARHDAANTERPSSPLA